MLQASNRDSYKISKSLAKLAWKSAFKCAKYLKLLGKSSLRAFCRPSCTSVCSGYAYVYLMLPPRLLIPPPTLKPRIRISILIGRTPLNRLCADIFRHNIFFRRKASGVLDCRHRKSITSWESFQWNRCTLSLSPLVFQSH